MPISLERAWHDQPVADERRLPLIKARQHLLRLYGICHGNLMIAFTTPAMHAPLYLNWQKEGLLVARTYNICSLLGGEHISLLRDRLS
jgi:hypothetical protein